jgi:hypothetical protein
VAERETGPLTDVGCRDSHLNRPDLALDLGEKNSQYGRPISSAAVRPRIVSAESLTKVRRPSVSVTQTRSGEDETRYR